MEKKRVVVITGPTATGKTALAVRLAREFNGEIISVDSRQVYRGMDLGTGKDLDEYREIPVHLIDVADPASETYHLARFCREAFAAIDDISARGKLPVLCGGTVLYLAALLEGYRLPGGAALAPRSEAPREKRDPAEPPSFTPPFALDALTLGVYFPRTEVRARIEARLDDRFTDGMVDEVMRLHDIQGVSWEKLAMFGLEYREIALYCQKKCTFSEMRQQLLNKIRQFAKRQDIFFRKLERENVRIYWLKGPDREAEAGKLMTPFLQGIPLPPPCFRLADVDYGKEARRLVPAD